MTTSTTKRRSKNAMERTVKLFGHPIHPTLGPFRLGRLGIATVALLGLFVAGAAGGLARYETPAAAAQPAGHPAHVHRGTCDTLDPAPLFPLADAVAAGAGAPQAGGTAGAAVPPPVASSVTTLQLPLANILASQHAINAHESAVNIQRYIACGEIAGAPDARGNLFVELREQNASGFSGAGWLRDNGNGTTTAILFLAQGLTGTPAAGLPAATDTQAATIRMVDFAFEPATTQVKAGTTVTWVNDGPTPHTSTASSGATTWDSGILQAGQSFSFTFDQPGSLDYLCLLHPSMTAHIDVVL